MSSNPQPPAQPPALASPPVSLVLTVVLLVAFFVGFFSIFFCRCIMESMVFGWQRNQATHLENPSNPQESSGLDPSLVQLFPTFAYSSVKDFKREEYGLECAICLGEFSEEDELRLLTVCFHVFHQECIDLWLESHKTCPVCRRDLDLPKEVLEKTPLVLDQDSNIASHVRNISEHVSIEIRDDHGRENGEETSRNDGEGTADDDHEDEHMRKQIDPRPEKVERFPRSRSTGHSIRVNRGEEQGDRYTLRLLDNVKVKITRGHCATGSCVTFGEFSSPKNGGLGEVSGGGS
ncbi:hypothetical protein Tsubulata_014541 [Turnera subulata]|uniref:RING-type E3 ubiquitin transferase n=1 Tax=Turnera subulata TaxID=218843 RepID=A0A9Q0J632_9ROSI|nr:hypothetical protein Tsubulata_014541 [Turnera subulata]